MTNILPPIVMSALLLASCNNLKDDFFYFIFGTTEISIIRECESNPPVTNEGRFIEIYGIREEDINEIVRSINNYSVPTSKYSKTYKPPVWKTTPVPIDDPVFQFIRLQFEEETGDLGKINSCFTESEITKILVEKRNYYLPLEDRLGRIRLFVLDCKRNKLFLITSYIL